MKIIITAIMVIGTIVSVTMTIPYRMKSKREKLFAMKSDEKVIECETSDWKKWILRGILLVVMAASIMFIWEVGINNRISFLLYGIYVISFCWHFIIYVKLDRKYYFTQDGIWIDQITGEKISYDNLEIIKIWRTTAPFSGCSGNLKIRMNYNNKKYTAFLVPIEDEDGNEDTEIKMLLEWLPEPKYKGISDNRKQLYRRAGIICIIAGVSLVVFFGFKFAVLSGAFDNNGDDLQVAAVVKEEYKGYARYAVEDSKGNVYILIRNRGIVNKYNRSKVFLYAYKVPVGKRGYVSITIRNDYLYIKNRDDKVFIFNEEDFIETNSISELDKETGDQLTADNEMTEKLELFTKSLGYASGEGIEIWLFAGIILIILGGWIYNRGRY